MDLREFGTVISGNRGKDCEFTVEARAAIVAARASGKTRREVADAFGTERVETVTNIVNNFITRNTAKSAYRKGAPRLLSRRSEHRIVVLARRQPRATYAALKVEARTKASISTIKRILYRHGLKKWRAARRINLTEEDAEQRLQFCRYFNSPDKIRTLLNTFYSDECTVQNDPDSPGVWVIRYSGERYRYDLVNPESHGRPRISVMVWAMIWQRDGEGGRSPLVFPEPDDDAVGRGVTSRSYQSVLEEGLLPFYEPGDTFMQDNARIHKFGGTPEWLMDHGIWTLDWPAHSPDLNPIEHVWRALKAKIRQIEPRFQNLKDNIADQAWAREVIAAAWSEINDGYIATLIQSMGRRIRACLRARGWYTYY
jgi:transposase